MYITVSMLIRCNYLFQVITNSYFDACYQIKKQSLSNLISFIQNIYSSDTLERYTNMSKNESEVFDETWVQTLQIINKH